MILIFPKVKFVFKSILKSLPVFALIISSFFGSLERAFAQITITKTYTSSQTVTITDIAADYPGFDPSSEIFAVANVDLLIVGGGGGGGERGGGGGGEVKLISIDLNLGATLNISIGAGGFPNNGGQQGDGDNTGVTLNTGATTNTYIALGGGSGGRQNDGSSRNGRDSGSGGGGGTGNNQSTNGAAGGTGIGSGGGTSYVRSGGSGTASGSNRAGGGGGGAGSAGTAGTTAGVGGNGGAGRSFAQFPGLTFSAGGRGSGNNGNGTAGTGYGGFGSGGNSGVTGFAGVVIVQITYRILPVEFSKFDVTYNSESRSSKVSWETAKEWQNSHFEIERSINSAREWETIGRMEGNGYSDGPIEYNFYDFKLPVAGGNIFYRLKQVDFEGSFSYSDTKLIKIEPLPGTTHWRVFPNPTTGYSFNIELLDSSGYRDEPLTLRVISPIGQYEFIQVDEIRGIGAQVGKYFEQKTSGVYTIEIAWGAKREYQKVILKK